MRTRGLSANTDPPVLLIWAADGDGRRHLLNRAWFEFTGSSIHNLSPNGWTGHLHPDDAERCLSEYFRAFHARRSFEMAYRLRCADGEYRWILEQGAPRFGLDGSFRGYVGCAIDNGKGKADQAQTMLTHGPRIEPFSSRAMHHFANLLGCILAEAGSTGAQMAAERVSVHAQKILREFMLCEASDLRGRNTVDLHQLADDLASLLGPCVPNGSRFRFDLAASLPLLQASAAQVRLILLHLMLVSAFSPEGLRRTVTVRARTKRLSRDVLRMKASAGAYVCLEISGSRAFAGQEQAAACLDRDTSACRSNGCRTIQNVIQSSDGAIQVTTHSADESRLQLLFPAAGAAPAAQLALNHRSRPLPRPQGPILLVEDEVTLRLAVSTMLCNRGFTVLEAGTGELALDLIRTRKRIAVVLLDLTLPGKSGRQVFEEMRRIRPRLKVILTSAHGSERVSPSFGGLQHAGFIRKPYRFQELEELIRKVLPAC
jgi:PAS domain S-box-containing protein